MDSNKEIFQEWQCHDAYNLDEGRNGVEKLKYSVCTYSIGQSSPEVHLPLAFLWSTDSAQGDDGLIKNKKE